MPKQLSLPLFLFLGTLLVALGTAHLIAEEITPAPPSSKTSLLKASMDTDQGEHKGQALYNARCASCHEGHEGRALPKSQMAGLTTAEIMNALFDGVMQQQAAGLVLPDVIEIANFISKNDGSASQNNDNTGPYECDGAPPPLQSNMPQWNGWGLSAANLRFQTAPGLDAEEVPNLAPAWAVPLSGARNGQPTIFGGRLFIANTSGAIYSLDAYSGCAYWKIQTPVMARTTITIDVSRPGTTAPRFTAYFMDYESTVYAVNAETGDVFWKTKVDDQASAIGTGSPTVHGGRVFVPISSGEALYAASDDYPCCRFRGALAALDSGTGTVLWKTYTTPIEAKPIGKNAKGVQMFGPAGGAIWSAPTVDPKRGVVYVGTGNRYTNAEHAGAEAVIAFDIETGQTKWIQKLSNGLPSIMGCYFEPYSANCPPKLGGNHDFGSSPILFDLDDQRQLILAAQKSGLIYALDPDRGGEVVWTTRVSAGGQLGGIQFGPAVDENRLFAGAADIFVGEGAQPGLTALDPETGSILWYTASPELPCQWESLYCHPGISQAVTAIPGVVFAGALNGRLRAYNSSNGEPIWDFDTGGTLSTVRGPATGGVLDAAGPVVADGMLYITTGYGGRQGHSSSVLIAFSVNGEKK